VIHPPHVTGSAGRAGALPVDGGWTAR